MIERPVTLPFKGDRAYLHGTDMYNTIMEAFPGADVHKIVFTIHRILYNPSCILMVADGTEDLSAVDACPVRCKLSTDGAPRYVGLRESTSRIAREERRPYDVGQVLDRCRLEGRQIMLEGNSPFTFIETIIPMNKALLTTLLPDAPGKWFFTRLDLHRNEKRRDGLGLRFLHNLDFKLVKSEITGRGETLGYLYFTAVPAWSDSKP